MAYSTNTLIARRGYSGLGGTASISVPAVVTQTATLWTTASGTGAARSSIPKGTRITIVEVSGSRVKIGGGVGTYYGYWVDRSSVTEAPSTTQQIGSGLLDFLKGAGGSLLSSATTAAAGKIAGQPGQQVYVPPAPTVGGLPVKTIAIAGGVVLLVALLARRRKD